MKKIGFFKFSVMTAAALILPVNSFAVTSYISPYSFDYPTVLADYADNDPNKSFELTVANGSLTYGVVGYNDDTSVATNGYSTVTVTGVYSVNDNALTNNLMTTNKVYAATGYLGIFGAKNDGPLPDMTDADGDGNVNIGQMDDGYMNGSVSVQNKDAGYPYYEIEGSDDVYNFSGLEFLGSYEDVDGDGVDDPGWIYLGKNDDSDGESYATVTKATSEGILTLDVSDAVKFHLDFGNDGEGLLSWTLEMYPDTLGLVQPILGNNTFDHLALAIKSSTAFEIFDIDFNKIFTWEYLSGTTFNFEPYTITGTLATSWGQGVSHVSVWAHDPPPSNPPAVPEPGTFVLVGAGLLGLGLLKRRK